MENPWNALINCEVNLILAWSENCVIIYTDVANQNTTFVLTEAKLYVPVVTLSTQDNTKLLQERKINWNKYLSKPKLLAQNPNLNHLVEPSFQGVNKTSCFIIWRWCTKNKHKMILSSKCYLSKDYNVTMLKNNKITL